MHKLLATRLCISSSRTMNTGSPSSGTAERLIGVIAGRLLAGQIEDVFRSGDDQHIDAAVPQA